MDNSATVTGDEERELWGWANEGHTDEQVGDLGAGDPVWVAIIHNDGDAQDPSVRPGSYGLECNDYGQRAQYRFLSREAALAWFEGVTADLA